MLFDRFRKPVRGRIVVIDSVLPSKNAIGPRHTDLLEFAAQLPDFTYYTMYPMRPGKDAWFTHGYGMTKAAFTKNLAHYVGLYPEAKGKIRLLSKKKKYQFDLAYTYFLAETYTLLPFLEKNRIPFVFLLNPGGAFGFDNESSDKMLRVVCASPYFRKVIVNQKRFEEYLIKKKLCPASKILYDFSGSVQFKPADVVAKRRYPDDKQTFDICFVGAKYTPQGVDKGYDLFIKAAKKLAKYRDDIRFHVVGAFDESEIDVRDIRDRITFYGFMLPAELPSFYSGMDIYLSPNRPFKIYEGNTDGFPLSAGAMYCGVCGFNTDELKLNVEFKDDEVVIVKPQVGDIVAKVKHFYENLDELYAVSEKGQRKAQFHYDIDKHIAGRIKLFKQLQRSAA